MARFLPPAAPQLHLNESAALFRHVVIEFDKLFFLNSPGKGSYLHVDIPEVYICIYMYVIYIL